MTAGERCASITAQRLQKSDEGEGLGCSRASLYIISLIVKSMQPNICAIIGSKALGGKKGVSSAAEKVRILACLAYS